MVGRYIHAHQFKRANRELRFLRKRLGRLIRDINRKTAGNEELTARFGPLRSLAVRVLFQQQRQRGQKLYALHAPEVECIGKGKAHPIPHDREMYKWRHLVENFFCNLKQFRRIATRYIKTNESFTAIINLIGAVLAMR
jgi:hypothetical protein